MIRIRAGYEAQPGHLPRLAASEERHVMTDGHSTRSRLAKRFWAKVDTTTTPDGCWLWTGAKNSLGYGNITVKLNGRHRTAKAHRVAFFLEFGRWPDPCGLHGCDTPACVRVGPGHVFEGTVADNTADMIAKGRSRFRQQWSTCKRGHPMVPGNLYVDGRGSRSCRTCQLDRQRERLPEILLQLRLKRANKETAKIGA